MGTFILGVFIVCLYFLPSFIAAERKKNSGAIFGLNLLLGWTFLGWVVALVWALTKDDVPGSISQDPSGNSLNPELIAPGEVSGELERLKALLDSGHLTQSEFNDLKLRVLSGFKA